MGHSNCSFHRLKRNPSTTMQPLIPVDVMVAILEHVDRSDLPSLCRVNKIVCRYSKDVLYRHVDLSAANVMSACCTICNAPDLASRVTSFSLRGGADVSSYLGVVQDVLAIMTRLRTLKLFIGPHGSWILPEPKACPFRLHSFACGFAYNSELVTFLNGQPELKVISAMLCSINANERYRVHFGPTLFPNLTRLSGPLSLLQKLIVGRPVRDVVTYSDDRDPTLLDCLSRSTAPNGIQRLEIDLKYLRGVRRTYLASILPGLGYLTVTALDIDPEDDEVRTNPVKYKTRLMIFSQTIFADWAGPRKLGGTTAFYFAWPALLHYSVRPDDVTHAMVGNGLFSVGDKGIRIDPQPALLHRDFFQTAGCRIHMQTHTWPETRGMVRLRFFRSDLTYLPIVHKHVSCILIWGVLFSKQLRKVEILTQYTTALPLITQGGVTT